MEWTLVGANHRALASSRVTTSTVSVSDVWAWYDPVRLHTPICSHPPPFQRDSSYCCELLQRQQGFCPRSLLSSAQGGNRGGPLFGPKPRRLQPLLSSLEEGWGFVSYTRSAQAELLPLQREIQDADAQGHSFPGPRGGLVRHCRLEGCLLPHPGGSETQEVPQVRLRGKGLPIQGSSLWASSGPKDVPQVYGAEGIQGIRILNYLDDWLILASSREQVIRHRDSLLRALGLRLNGQKSVLTPAQQTTFLGVCLDSTSMQARLAPARVESIQSCSARFWLGRRVSVGLCRRLLGLMAAASPVIPLGLLHMRPFLWWMKSLVIHPSWPSLRLLRVSGACLHALLVWQDPNFLWTGVIMGVVCRRQMITTDASLSGWGADFKGRPACGVWSGKYLAWHINGTRGVVADTD